MCSATETVFLVLLVKVCSAWKLNSELIDSSVEIFSASGDDTSAGTGARTVTIYGLDENWEAVSEPLTLNGASAVTSTNSYHRVHLVEVETAGSGGGNAGALTVRHTTTTANVFASVPAGLNRSHIAAYTIPDDHTGWLVQARIAIGRANGSAGQAEMRILSRESGGVYRALRRAPLTTAFPWMLPSGSYVGPLNERSDVLVRIQSVSDSNTAADADLVVLLVQNQDT